MYLPHEERLRDGGWLSLELRQLWGDPTAAPNERVMEEREPGCLQPAGRMRGNGHELKDKSFRQDIKTYSFHTRTLKTVGWAAQRGCPVSVLGDFQDPAG